MLALLVTCAMFAQGGGVPAPDYYQIGFEATGIPKTIKHPLVEIQEFRNGVEYEQAVTGVGNLYLLGAKSGETFPSGAGDWDVLGTVFYEDKKLGHIVLATCEGETADFIY